MWCEGDLFGDFIVECLVVGEHGLECLRIFDCCQLSFGDGLDGIVFCLFDRFEVAKDKIGILFDPIFDMRRNTTLLGSIFANASIDELSSNCRCM